MSLPLRSCTLTPHQSRKVISGQTKKNNDNNNNNNNNNYLKTGRYLKKERKGRKRKRKKRLVARGIHNKGALYVLRYVGLDLTRNVRMEAYTKDNVKFISTAEKKAV